MKKVPVRKENFVRIPREGNTGKIKIKSQCNYHIPHIKIWVLKFWLTIDK